MCVPVIQWTIQKAWDSEPSVLAEPSWALAHTVLIPPSPRGRHIGPQEAPQGRPDAPQAVVGYVVLLHKRSKTFNVPAEQAGGVGKGHSTMGNARGMLVELEVGLGAAAENGWLVW